jgi:hypothetical protein
MEHSSSRLKKTNSITELITLAAEPNDKEAEGT